MRARALEADEYFQKHNPNIKPIYVDNPNQTRKEIDQKM